MISVKQAIVVEGKYDKIKLSSFIDTMIIETNGFRIFKDKEKIAMLKLVAEKRGLIVLTDSDAAGFQIRNYIKSTVGTDNVINVYTPDLFGKEKRKKISSKEGKLGVEGISKEVLLEAFKKAGVFASESEKKEKITKADLFEVGLSGGKDSKGKRKKLLNELDLPEYLSTNGLIDMLNIMMDRETFMSSYDK